MRAELMLCLLLGAGPAGAAQDASAAGEAAPSPALLEFLGGLVELEGELLGPLDLEVPSEAAPDADGEPRGEGAGRTIEEEP